MYLPLNQVLLVEDDPKASKIAANFLNTLGYVVTVCSSGEQALKTIGVTTFDVLLTDFELGGEIDGLALLDLVQKSAPQTALILMPADPAEAKKVELIDPYGLRANGLDQALPLTHFGRAVFHLNQRRGFKSNRKTDRGDNESGKVKDATARLVQEVFAPKQTCSKLYFVQTK